MTILIAITHDKAVPLDWHPWTKCRDLPETLQLAARRFVRDRGGILEHEFPLRIYIWSHCPDDAKKDDGSPLVVTCTEFVFHPKQETVHA